MNLHLLKSRNHLASWLNAEGLVGAGVEVGVLHGCFAAQMLPVWQGQAYWMVDIWENYEGSLNKVQDGQFDLFRAQCAEIAQAYPIAKLIRCMSVNAANSFADNSLDWVYIDANHDYKPVLEDLDAWYPKVKPGGLFGGHDFYNSDVKFHECRVERALKEWATRNHKAFYLTPCTSWWMIKE